MIKVTLTHYKWSIYKDGTSPLFVQLLLKRQRHFIKTGVNCKQSDWNEKTTLLRKSFPNHDEWNKKIIQQLANTQTQIFNCISLDEAKKKLAGEPECSDKLDDYIKTAWLSLEAQNRFSSASTYKCLQNSLNKFRPNSKLSDLNHKFISDFYTYLRSFVVAIPFLVRFKSRIFI